MIPTSGYSCVDGIYTRLPGPLVEVLLHFCGKITLQQLYSCTDFNVGMSGETMAEVSSVVELHILSFGLAALMGTAFVWLGLKNNKTEISLRMPLLQMGLLFLVNSLIFVLYILRDSESIQLSEVTSDIIVHLSTITNAFTLSQILILTMLFPAPLASTREGMRTLIAGVLIAFVALFFLSMVLESGELMTGALFWTILTIVYFSVASLILIRWFIVHCTSDDPLENNAAVASGLMFFAVLGAGIIQWPFRLFPLGKPGGSSYVFDSQGEEIRAFLALPYTISSLGLFVFLIGSAMIAKGKRDKSLFTVSFLFMAAGLINLAAQYMSSETGEFRELWDYFVVTGIFGLVRPLLLILLVLRFNLIDLTDVSIRGRIRVLSLLIITVWASGFFEIIQAFIPLPQLLSAALIGALLAFAIGWEEKLFDNLLSGSGEKMLPVTEDFYDEDDPYLLVMVTGGFLVLCVVFAFLSYGGF